MNQHLAVVVTDSNNDPGLTSNLEALGFHISIPRRPTIEAIAQSVPDLILIDWSPGAVANNTSLLDSIRSIGATRLVPVLVTYSSKDDVPPAVWSDERVIALELPCSPSVAERAIRRAIGDVLPSRDDVSVPQLDFWSWIHPIVHRVARSRFEARHFADAAEAAMKAVNQRVKEKWVAAGKPEKDGADLMFAALDLANPVFRLADSTTQSGKSMQEGYKHLFAGAMMAIRNPKAHDNITISEIRCRQFVMFASLLMEKLDEAS